MYKDKDKQREANAERQRRYKARHKGVTSEGVTDKALPKHEVEFIEKVSEIFDVPTGLKRGKFIDEQGNAHVPDQEYTRLLAADKPKAGPKPDMFAGYQPSHGAVCVDVTKERTTQGNKPSVTASTTPSSSDTKCISSGPSLPHHVEPA